MQCCSGIVKCLTTKISVQPAGGLEMVSLCLPMMQVSHMTPMMKSQMTPAVCESNPQTSSMPPSSGSTTLRLFVVMPQTISFAVTPNFCISRQNPHVLMETQN